jgi:hypothetical protein
MGELPAEIRRQRLQEYEFSIRQMLQQLEPVKKELSSTNFDDKDYFMASTFYFSYQILHHTIRWIEYVKEQKPLSMFLLKKGV